MRERGDLHLHVRKQGQSRKDRMQLVMRVNVEDTIVRILADDAMQLLPLSLPLKLLRVFLFASFDLIGLGSRHVVRQIHSHLDKVKHSLSPERCESPAVQRQEKTETVEDEGFVRSISFACRDDRKRAFLRRFEDPDPGPPAYADRNRDTVGAQ
jgi:hypothetical protein